MLDTAHLALDTTYHRTSAAHHRAAHRTSVAQRGPAKRTGIRHRGTAEADALLLGTPRQHADLFSRLLLELLSLMDDRVDGLDDGAQDFLDGDRDGRGVRERDCQRGGGQVRASARWELAADRK